MNLFCLHPWTVTKKNRVKITDNETGPHLFLRHNKDALQAYLSQRIDFSQLPKVFLYGNPHIDNYARTNTGCGMVDFDSAMHGPYLIDVFSLLISVHLRLSQQDYRLDPACTDAFLAGYLETLANPNDGYQSYQPLLEEIPEEWQLTAAAYLDNGKKWAKKLQKFPLPSDDPIINSILQQYFASRQQDGHEQDFIIKQAGQGIGSMGRVHNLIVLEHKKTHELQLIDIKHTKDYINLAWPHHQFYHHDFTHQGERMIAASQLHAPGVTDKEGVATLNGVQYWGCELPTINLKIKGLLNSKQAEQFSYAVGTQMGRSHALSSTDSKALMKHINTVYPQLLMIVKDALDELIKAWEYYCDIYHRSI